MAASPVLKPAPIKAAQVGKAAADPTRLEQEDQGDHHGKNRRRLTDGRADQHVGGNAPGGGWLPGDGQTGPSGRDAGPDAGADGAEPHAQTGGQKRGRFHDTWVGNIHEQQQDRDHQ
jgi:hypothetical protein